MSSTQLACALVAAAMIGFSFGFPVADRFYKRKLARKLRTKVD